MRTVTYTLYSHFASALVNGDYSGLDEDEDRELELFLRAHPDCGQCLSVSEESEFGQSESNRLRGNVSECTFERLSLKKQNEQRKQERTYGYTEYHRRNRNQNGHTCGNLCEPL